MNFTVTRTDVRAPDFVLGAGALLMASAQIAIPLTATSPALASLTVLGMALCAFGGAWRSWGIIPATQVLAVIGVAGLLIEVIGSRTGIPFGSYDYTGRLVPIIAGVPIIVALAWFAMGAAAWATVAFITERRLLRILLGAVALTAWDVFLDPQMVDAGFWAWEPGSWWTFRGIPLVNYGGWLLFSLVVMGILEWLAGPPRSVPLLGLYTWVAVMQTIGFLVFFGDPVVGVAGGAAMLPFVVLGWMGVRRA